MDTLWFYRAYCVNIVSPMLWGSDIVFIQRVLCFLSPSLGFFRKYFFLREQIELWPENLFCATCETGWAWLTEKTVQSDIFLTVNIKLLQNVTIINQLCAFDYNLYAIMILCPFVHHWCMALSFVMCSIVKNVRAWVCEFPHYFF